MNTASTQRSRNDYAENLRTAGFMVRLTVGATTSPFFIAACYKQKDASSRPISELNGLQAQFPLLGKDKISSSSNDEAIFSDSLKSLIKYQSSKSNSGLSSNQHLFSKSYQLLKIRLDEIAGFSDDWNGYGAEPIKAEIISDAYHFLEHVYSLSDFVSVFPTARQSIQFEFEDDNKYCEAEIFVERVLIYSEKEGDELSEDFDSVDKAAIFFVEIFNG